MPDTDARRGFAPGHASGFFSVKTSRGQDEACGSTGAGVCLSLGALSEVTVERGSGDVEVTAEHAPGGAPDTLPVTETALEILLERSDRWDVSVRTQFQLPLGQGLGMSAAGALSATLPAAGPLDQGRYEAVRAAHLAELHHATGLGDVAAQIQGGLVVRQAAGIPPYGMATTIPADLDLVVAVVGDPVRKPAILQDADRMETVSALGDQALDHLLDRPGVERFFDVSRAFADQAGFVPDEAGPVLKALDAHGRATVALIGSTVLAAGDGDAMVGALGDDVEVYRARTASRGARKVS